MLSIIRLYALGLSLSILGAWLAIEVYPQYKQNILSSQTKARPDTPPRPRLAPS